MSALSLISIGQNPFDLCELKETRASSPVIKQRPEHHFQMSKMISPPQQKSLQIYYDGDVSLVPLMFLCCEGKCKTDRSIEVIKVSQLFARAFALLSIPLPLASS